MTRQKQRIRVVHFHSSKGLYGPERWTYLVLRALADSEIDQEVLTIGTKPGYGDFTRFLIRHGLPAHHLALSGKFTVQQVRAIRALLVERRVDVLHTHGFKSDILGYFATRYLPIGLVSTPHGWCDHESLRIRLYEMVGRQFLRGFDRIYPLSDHQLEVLKAYRLGTKVRCIKNAVDLSNLEGTWKERQTSPPREPMILFVGRLAREKGLIDLIEACAIVARNRRFQVVIVGEGPAMQEAYASATRTGVVDRITFAGFVEDVRPFLRAATVLALPSYSEGLPRVVMEAFGAGVAVVGTDIPGLRELIVHGRTGLLIPVGNNQALASALETLLIDTQLNSQIAEEARDLITRDYSPQRLAEELRDEYRRIAADT